MLTRISDWLDERTSYRALVSHALDEEIAGGPRFIYVFGSALAVIFSVQVVTGLMLMATYTPALSGAWSSVFYVQHAWPVVGSYVVCTRMARNPCSSCWVCICCRSPCTVPTRSRAR